MNLMLVTQCLNWLDELNRVDPPTQIDQVKQWLRVYYLPTDGTWFLCSPQTDSPCPNSISPDEAMK
ncbi:hypothetical protein AG1IA_04546 [Rhizoctonia solani AG-1 IA]|uniref:Uncharacterized protein n=1 Tax=Thanatephorus cucumeris (strain AG1-IA) TaxID=983506 RepID=L8WXC7_THACA|nr:hypothetical protein AG1IA_04546 [Rhizoctonia solani AG-1 IA]